MSDAALKIQSPVGDLEWIFITGKGKKDLKGNDRYSANVVMDSDNPTCQSMKEEIEIFWQENKPKKVKTPKSLGFRPVLDDNDEDTGKTSFSFWTGIVFPDGQPKVVKVFNAKGAEVALGNKKIGNGSRGRIKGVMDIYQNGAEAGVTLYLNGIQLTKFVEFTGGVSFDETEDDEGEGFEGFEEDGMGAISDKDQAESQPRL